MARNRSRKWATSFFESLEDRRLLSHSVFTSRLQLTSTTGNAEIGASLTMPLAAKLTAAGLPLRTATILFVEDGTTAIGEGVTGRSGYATAVVPTFYPGEHSITAVFQGATRYQRSQSGSQIFTISAPSTFTTTSDGTKESTVVAGTGSATLQLGGNFTADYTGYVKSTGAVFDASILDGQQLQGEDLSDMDGGELIDGFAQGIEGMKAGETRILDIPGAAAYGNSPPSGLNIPDNAELVFVIHIDSLD